MSTSTNGGGLVTDMAGMRESAGTHLGYTEWQEMTQEPRQPVRRRDR